MKRIFIAVAVLLVIGLAGLRMALPGIVREKAETQLTELLGTPVTIADVDLALLRGAASINGLKIAQLPGFGGEELLSIGSFSANVRLFSLMSDTIVVQSVKLDGVKANFERNAEGQSNVALLRDRLTPKEKEDLEAAAEAIQVPGEEEAAPEPPESPGEPEPAKPAKAYVLKSFELGSVDLAFADRTQPADAQQVGITLGELRIEEASYFEALFDAELGDLLLEIEDLSVQTTPRFTEHAILEIPSLSVSVDLPRILRTRGNPEIVVTSFAMKDARVVREKFKRKRDSENIKEFRGTMMASLGKPIPLTELYPDEDWDDDDDDDEEVEEEEEEEAVTAEPEEKKGFLGGLFSKKENDKKSGATSPTVTPTPTPAAAEQPSGVAAPTSADKKRGYKSITLKSFEIIGFDSIEIDNRKEKREEIADINVDIRDLTVPQQPGDSALLTVRAHPFNPASSAAIKLQGNFLRDDGAINTLLSVSLQQYPMNTSSKFKSGVLDLDLDLDIEDSVAKGMLKFKVDAFQLDDEEREDLKSASGIKVVGALAKRATYESFEAISALGAQTIPVPLAFPIKGTNPWMVAMEIYTVVWISLSDAAIGLAKNLQDAAVGAVKDVGGAAIDGAQAVGGLATDGASAAAGAAGDAASAVGEGVKDVTGAVGGLFGGGKDDPTPTPTPEPEQ